MSIAFNEYTSGHLAVRPLTGPGNYITWQTCFLYRQSAEKVKLKRSHSLRLINRWYVVFTQYNVT